MFTNCAKSFTCFSCKFFLAKACIFNICACPFFREYLDLDIAIPSDKAQELSNAIINYANSAIIQLRRLFLVEDLVDSGKFGLVLYLLTYIGGWFNGLTLLILGKGSPSTQFRNRIISFCTLKMEKSLILCKFCMF